MKQLEEAFFVCYENGEDEKQKEDPPSDRIVFCEGRKVHPVEDTVLVNKCCESINLLFSKLREYVEEKSGTHEYNSHCNRENRPQRN